MDSYRFSNWDRRCGFDRRRGPRRVREIPVITNQRRRTDRREASRDRRLIPGANLPQPVGRFRQAAAILAPGVLQRRSHVHAPNFKVLARRATNATVYSAWEEADAVADGADYRPIRGRTYRRIGSALHVFESLDQIEEAERFYTEECRRAYEVIYGQHPEFKGTGIEMDGEVILEVNGNGSRHRGR
jgi:hypothetical protein